MWPPRAYASALALATLWVVHPASAQQSNSVGDARTGLPGVVRVPIQEFRAPRIAAALDTGYGLTEGQNGGGAHHRALGSLGVGFVPIPWLEFGLLNTIRYDWHPDDGAGTDSGTVGQPSLVTRVGSRLGRAFRLGADLGVAFPGSERVADSLRSPAIDLRALFGWVPAVGVRYAGFAGFRLDQTAGVGENASRYRAGDRLALGLSDFNAVLLGAGVVAPFGQFELLGELSGDLLVGAGAPPMLQSPLRANVGMRRAINRQLAAELMTECSLSARPDTSPNAPLVPVEARFSIMVGIRYRIWSNPDRSTVQISTPPTLVVATKPNTTAPTDPASTDNVAAPDTGRAVVMVYDSAGHPLSDAVVTITAHGEVITLAFENGSTFIADSVPTGQVRLTVRADLMRDSEQEVQIAKDKPLELRVNMVAAETSGQIRGLVRGFDGKSLQARVHVDPGDRNEQAGPDGVFSVNVVPGKYRVRVFLQGYQAQERDVEVGKNGVMVLNVDLQKGQ